MSSLVIHPVSAFCTPVTQADRALVLALHFPKAHLRFENFVHLIAGKICPCYEDVPWECFELSNGGLYMAPNAQREYQLDLPFGRKYRGIVSSDAFGIICCLYAFCFLAEEDEQLAYHHVWLSSFSQSHPESATIWWAAE